MTARLAGLLAVVLLAVGASPTVGAYAADTREFRAATRLARDGDLQADWNKLLDARARLERLTSHPDIAARVHFELGYLEWRLSALAYMSTGFRGQVPHWRRAVTELERAVALRPDLADAHGLIALCSTLLLAADPSQADRLKPRIDAAWKAALDAMRPSPRAQLFRAMTVFSTPPSQGGNQATGIELWREAIAGLESEKPTDPLAPEWGLAEAWGWLGGAYLMQGDTASAKSAFARALTLRKDFWWVARVALPQAGRPAAPAAAATTADRLSAALSRFGLSSAVVDWVMAVAAAIERTIDALGDYRPSTRS
jgi:tetratricopeptide (TPR) repeat protein